MQAECNVIPSPLVGEGRVRGGGASRLNTELPAFTLIPAFCLRGPPSREKEQKRSCMPSPVQFPLPLWERARERGRRKPLKHRVVRLHPHPNLLPAWPALQGEGVKAIMHSLSDRKSVV